MHLPIFIIGMPAAGKTFFGQQIAGKLHIPFIDTDKKVLELYYQKNNVSSTILEIFKRDGEKAFRILERQVIRKIEKKFQIVACGGGLPCYFDNIEYMINNGIVIYLNTEMTIIIERHKLNLHKSPLLEEKNNDQISKIILNLFKKRIHFYNKGQLIDLEYNYNIDNKILIINNLTMDVDKFNENK